jgi:D-alanine-D-alanine ligase
MSLPSVAVLLGGPSAEREVSLRSGSAVARALRAAGHSVVEIDPKPGALSLPKGVEVAFVALHGTYGEDGGVQTELEALGVPYTGCGPAASRTAFDKAETKARLNAAGIRTPRGLVLETAPDAPPADAPPAPFVVKPARQGSSVGLAFAETAAELPGAVRHALAHDTRVLVEERIAGREITAGVLGGEALPVVEVRPKAGAYDYANKYTPGRTEYLCPAPFDEDTTRRIRATALGAFDALGCRDYARIDMIVTPSGEPVVLEVNTLPGMTETSLLPKAAAAAGMDFTELCRRMIAMAIGRSAGGGPK